MNSVEKQTVLHCLRSMIDEELCEECPLYGMTGTDHCEKDCVRLAINALSSSENTPKQSFEGMTNGEVMGAVFPKAKVSRYIDEYERPSDYLIHIDDETYFTKEWWNAPYKGGAE